MKSKKVGAWVFAAGVIVASYSACSPFNGMDMVNGNISPKNTNLSSSDDSNNQNSNNETINQAESNLI